MEDIICPNCKKVFKVDEAGFADILRQVRNHQFNKELQERLEIANREKDGAVKLAESELKNSMQETLAKRDKKLDQLKAEKEQEYSKLLTKNQVEIEKLKSIIDNANRDILKSILVNLSY